jgi:hypothetical protein
MALLRIEHNVTCRGVRVTYKTGSGLDDWIYWHLIQSTRDYCSTHEVFLAQSNCLLSVSSQSPSMPSPELDSNLDNNSNDLLCHLITPRHGPLRKQCIYCWGLFTDPLPSNGRPVVARVRFHGNVFTKSLSSSGSIRHSIIVIARNVLGFVTPHVEASSVYLFCKRTFERFVYQGCVFKPVWKSLP